MKTKEVNPITALAAGYLLGAVFGLLTRKRMYDKGMVKSFWLPGKIQKPGTFRQAK